MEHRVIVGGSANGQSAYKKKILAADGFIGVVIMMSYYAGGTNLFPPSIDPRQYMLDEKLEGRAILTDLELLHKLAEELSEYIGQHLALLQAGSVPVYLCHLRQGFRANRQGRLPQVNVKYSTRTQELIIPPRDFKRDEAEGITGDIPSWIRFS